MLKAAALMGLIQIMAAAAASGFEPYPSALDPEPPFVICQNQQYALCAEASCFVYDGVAYCKCDIKQGNSISLQLSYAGPTGEQDVCDVNRQGKNNGYIVSTFSFPSDAKKGGPEAIYICPGAVDAGSGVSAPVAYGQCDGGICFKSSVGQRFPGFEGAIRDDQIICSCPISTGATPGSVNGFGYQIFGPYHPNQARDKRCDVSACAACSVPKPSANGAILPVGAASGTGEFLTLKLDGPPLPQSNECLCECTPAPNGTVSCNDVEDVTR